MLVIGEGNKVDFGATEGVIANYMVSVAEDQSYSVVESRWQHTHGTVIRIQNMTPLYDVDRVEFLFGQALEFDIDLASNADINGLSFGVTVLDVEGTPIFSSFSPRDLHVSPQFVSTYRLSLRDPRLAPGYYRLALSVFEGDIESARQIYDLVRPGITFGISFEAENGTSLYKWSNAYGHIMHPLISVHLMEQSCINLQ